MMQPSSNQPPSQRQNGAQPGHDPRAVANHIIKYAHRRKFEILNVSVQKLMFFAHSSLLVRHKRPLVRGAFEAWEFGPVSPPVYKELKSFGRAPITSLITRVDPFTMAVSIPEIVDDIVAEDEIDSIMRNMGTLHPNHLITLSHAKGGAWDVVWNKSEMGATLGNRIDDELIRQTYGMLKVRLDSTSISGGIDEATPVTGNRSR